MGIDTGLNLSYNQNYPIQNVNQSSQQFRDNFSVIKTAIERLQVATNSSASNFDLNVNQNTNGIVTIDVLYSGNSLTLPIGDPTKALSAGMIRYDSNTSKIQFYDGSGWRAVISQDSAGNVTFSNLTVTNRITTNNLTLNSNPTVGTDAVTLSYLNAALSGVLATSGYVTVAQLNTEIALRAAGDAHLQTEIDAIKLDITNAAIAAAATNITISNLSSAIQTEANSRISADSAQLGMISSLNTQVSQNQTNISNTISKLNQEISDRTNADSVLAQEISLANTALTNETAARIAGDLDLANSIANISNSLGNINGSTYLLTAGGSMTGNLDVYNASVNIQDGNLVLANSALYLPKSNITLDSGQYFLFNAIPNLVGGHDGAFITYDQNNFAYARMSSDTANAVAADIAANGIANANTHWELSCLRIGTTNDPDNGLNNDSIALEPAADLWLNPGWAGGGIANDGTGTPDLGRTASMGNASVYVGNATSWTIKMVRETGDIISNGSITAAGDISGLSDASLKDNVRTIENALDKIDNLRGVIYTRNDLPNNPEQIGLIAQEVQDVVPQIVHQTDNGLLSVSYGNLVALLIEGIKDLRNEIEDIKKKIQ